MSGQPFVEVPSASECRIYSRRKNTQLSLPVVVSRERDNNGRGARCPGRLLDSPCYTTVPPIVPAVCALPRPCATPRLCYASSPPMLLSTTTREMVIRYGLEVARNISPLNGTVLPSLHSLFLFFSSQLGFSPSSPPRIISSTSLGRGSRQVSFPESYSSVVETDEISRRVRTEKITSLGFSRSLRFPVKKQV